MFSNSTSEVIDNHLKQYFDENQIFVFDEIVSPDFHLDVYLIMPNSEREFYTLLTSGISSIPMNVPDPELNPYIELMMFLPKDWPFEDNQWRTEEYYWPIELLKSLGRYPHSNGTWLGLGHTIPESKTSYLYRNGFVASLLLKSSSVNMEFQSIPYHENKIDILMPIPIYQSEYEYKKEFGIKELLEKMVNHDIPEIVDIKRKNSVL
jgi:hypothetical protein